MKNILSFIIVTAMAATLGIINSNPETAAAAPESYRGCADPVLSLYESICPAPTAEKRHDQIAANPSAEGRPSPVVVEAHRLKPQKTRKVFSAAQFVCALPMENTETYTVVVSGAEEAEEAIRRIKKEGCNEITLKVTQPGDIYDAIVKTARQQDMRINA